MISKQRQDCSFTLRSQDKRRILQTDSINIIIFSQETDETSALISHIHSNNIFKWKENMKMWKLLGIIVKYFPDWDRGTRRLTDLVRLTRAPTGWVSWRLAFSSPSSSSLSLTGLTPVTFSRLLTWLERGKMLRLSSRKTQELLDARLKMNLSLNLWTTSWCASVLNLKRTVSTTKYP